MKLNLRTNKPHPFGLYSLVLSRLIDLEKTNSDIVSFALVFEKLCSSFQISKQQCWELLFMLKDFNFIRIIPGHGVKINGTR
jgi:hypothetical protein